LQGPSFLVGALFVCGATILPMILDVPVTVARIIRYSFGGALLLAVAIKILFGQPASYRVPGPAIAALVNDLRTPPAAGATEWTRNEDVERDIVMSRIGGPREWRARYPQPIVSLVTELRRQLGPRRVVIDDSSVPTSELYFHPGLLFFLGDLRVGSSVTDPTVSIWLASDYVRWQRDLAKSNPDCLVTFATELEADPMAQWFLARYPDIAQDGVRRGELARYAVLCRQR
jgi:hypothetical protein